MTEQNLGKHPLAWAWKMDGGLCYWAEPSRKQLMAKKDKPSPEAIPVRVRLVPVKEYTALRGVNP